MSHIKEPEYSEEIMKKVFGAGTKGRESFGLRFASVEMPELLDHPKAQLLFIAAREGSQGLEASLGEGRGEGSQSSSPTLILLPDLFDQHLRKQKIKKLRVG
jgi:hypothetical protein